MNDQFIQNVWIDWSKVEEGSYLRNIETIRKMERIDFHRSITFFVGENGSGKSTLLEAIAIASGFNPEGGTKNHSFSTRDTHSQLCDAIRISNLQEKSSYPYRIGGTFSDAQSTLLSFIQPFFFCGKP